MEAQGTGRMLARMVEMLYRQRFIGIEGVEEKVVPVEVRVGFYGLSSNHSRTGQRRKSVGEDHSCRLGFGT